MAYTEFNPSKKLKHIIDKFWLSDSHTDTDTSRIFPDCSMDIIFNLGDSYFSKDSFENNFISNVTHLICDQRYGEKEMQFQINKVQECLK